jgi:regulator of sigma E protease
MSRGKRVGRSQHPDTFVKRSINKSRVTLYSLILLAFPLAITFWGALESTKRLSLVLIGFSSIIFVHELGHFLVARACSVRCDVFSIGIGPRLFGWKKGIGLSFGKSPEDRNKKTEEETPAGAARGTGTIGDLEQTAEPKVTRNPSSPDKSVGETDYRISILPLGGYVRMLGQDDMDPTKISSDPRSFGRRPIWQRMCIVSAGVVMNVITAAIIFSVIFAPSVGVKNPPAISGEVMYNSPAANAGFTPGLRIVRIDDDKPLGYMEFTDLMIASALSKGDKPVKFETLDSAGQTKFIEVVPGKIPGVRFLAIGVSPMPSTQIVSIATDEEWKEIIKDIKNGDQLKRGDRITRIKTDGAKDWIILKDPKDNDTSGFDTGFVAMNKALQESGGKDVTITVENTSRSAPQDIVISPKFNLRGGNIGPTPGIIGMYPRVKILDVGKDSPAEKAGLQEGDVVLQVGSLQNKCPSLNEFLDTVKASPGKDVTLVVQREGSSSPLTIKVPAKKVTDDEGKPIGQLGVGVGGDYEHAVITTHDREAFFPVEEIRGSAITAINDKPVKSWTDVFDIGRAAEPNKPLKIDFTYPSGEKSSFTINLNGTADKPDPIMNSIANKVPAYAYSMGLPVEHLNWTQKASESGGLVEAMQMGMQHTWKFMQQTYLTLRGLFIGTVSPKELHGIVGIAKVGYDVQDRGLTHLFFILAVVSVNLAVANFLPLPIVDGGLFLMLILEKIRGKPLSLKLQHSIQLVGIVALIGLFLFVTWNDIIFVATGK